jgi:hypothetical protein
LRRSIPMTSISAAGSRWRASTLAGGVTDYAVTRGNCRVGERNTVRLVPADGNGGIVNGDCGSSQRPGNSDEPGRHQPFYITGTLSEGCIPIRSDSVIHIDAGAVGAPRTREFRAIYSNTPIGVDRTVTAALRHRDCF